VPEPDPETSFKANFSCHVLFKHLRGEVEQEMGGLEDLEVCPADECEYNIVQHKVRLHVLRSVFGFGGLNWVFGSGSKV
jgi:hypothetical protein